MFTGIVTDIGEIRALDTRGETRIEIYTVYDIGAIDIGASIACSGPCLTVVAKGVAGDRNWFAAQASAETLSKTTIGTWRVGQAINLERSLRVGDEIGGHIVSGHVDGMAKVISRKAEGESVRFLFEAPDSLKRFVAPKGSVSLDGVSLTVNEVDGARFGVNVIPHTLKVTTFGSLKTNDRVNMEIDVLARYVARLQAA